MRLCARLELPISSQTITADYVVHPGGTYSRVRFYHTRPYEIDCPRLRVRTTQQVDLVPHEHSDRPLPEVRPPLEKELCSVIGVGVGDVIDDDHAASTPVTAALAF
jgi:hypothetical protein